MYSIRELLGLLNSGNSTKRSGRAQTQRRRAVYGNMSDLSEHILRDIGVSRAVAEKYWVD